MRTLAARLSAATIAVAAVVGIVLLYRDYVSKSDGGLAIRTIQFFSFFTIESGLLVAVFTTALALAPTRRETVLIGQPAVAGAICLYASVTGVTYYFLLRHLYDPHGAELVATNLLHYVVPPAFVAFWLVFVPKGTLDVWSAAKWLIFPAVYAAYTLIRGAFAGWYPYPFVDVTVLGYVGVALSIARFILGFAAAALLILAVDRRIGPRERA